MKILGIVIALMGGGIASASPVCQPGTLSSYVALRTEGCSLQADGVTFTSPVVFRNFGFTPVSGVSTAAADEIEVYPVADPYAPALYFSSQEADGIANIAEDLSFAVSAYSISSADLFLEARETSGSGAAAAVASVCGSGGCATLADGGGAAHFSSVDSVTITDRLELQGFAASDEARIDVLQNSISTPDGYGFCDCAFTGGDPVPEVPSLVMVASAGVIFAAHRKWGRTLRTRFRHSPVGGPAPEKRRTPAAGAASDTPRNTAR